MPNVPIDSRIQPTAFRVRSQITVAPMTAHADGRSTSCDLSTV